ncbi:MAG TPA: pitrilysin family protein [Bacteroidia bacterium]|nr:pitrilysin family protein [Bacteroidia bacterium]
MISFEKFELRNGLKVIVNEDPSTPLAAMNILYKVGARDEDENKTGFAHLFEHLMFGGSVNIPNYDEPLQRAGGENNAFTNNDFTNYYLTLSAENLETAFWLESDRMLSLAFSEKSLDVQRNVVIEEFKQRYLNQPYGDVWLLLRPLAYKVHPYKWATIGKDISHIENAAIDDVKSFFSNYYRPENAILTLSGNVTVKQARELAEKWFEPITPGTPKGKNGNYAMEPVQKEKRILKVEKNVPASRIYKTYHCCSRMDKEFYATDLLSDVLSKGKSSRLYQSLVKEQKLFTEMNAYLMGDLDKSLFVFEGRLVNGVEMEQAEKAIDTEIAKIKNEKAGEKELKKSKQQLESGIVFSEINIANRALNLAYFEMLGNASDINSQVDFYNAVTGAEVQQVANDILREENCSVLYYQAGK